MLKGGRLPLRPPPLGYGPDNRLELLVSGYQCNIPLRFRSYGKACSRNDRYRCSICQSARVLTVSSGVLCTVFCLFHILCQSQFSAYSNIGCKIPISITRYWIDSYTLNHRDTLILILILDSSERMKTSQK